MVDYKQQSESKTTKHQTLPHSNKPKPSGPFEESSNNQTKHEKGLDLGFSGEGGR